MRYLIVFIRFFAEKFKTIIYEKNLITFLIFGACFLVGYAQGTGAIKIWFLCKTNLGKIASVILNAE